MQLTRTKKILGAAGVATLVIGGAGAAAWADSGSPSTTTAPAAGAAPAAHPKAAARARAILRRVDHGTLEVKDKRGQWITVDVDRGKVTSVAPDHITLARPDGKSVTLQLNATTAYQGVSGESAIQTGKGALVVSNPDGTARQVVQPKGAKAATS